MKKIERLLASKPGEQEMVRLLNLFMGERGTVRLGRPNGAGFVINRSNIWDVHIEPALAAQQSAFEQARAARAWEGEEN